ncbi:MAG: hypothetical protein U9N77_16235 [Thermodesulfobacteriota bacterium]|nr:hypothetical protein [Thermodesulfobacteriota bacterium]
MRQIVCIVLLFIWFTVSAYAGNHSELIKKSFSNARDVTERCLECHEEAGSDFMKTSHWLWTGDSSFLKNHDNKSAVGKKNLINNY